MTFSNQPASSKDIMELSLHRLRSLSGCQLVDGSYKETQRFRQMGALFDVALESCRSLNNVPLADELLYFEPLARQPDISTERRADLSDELGLLIAQIRHMSLDELSGPLVQAKI